MDYAHKIILPHTKNLFASGLNVPGKALLLQDSSDSRLDLGFKSWNLRVGSTYSDLCFSYL